MTAIHNGSSFFATNLTLIIHINFESLDFIEGGLLLHDFQYNGIELVIIASSSYLSSMLFLELVYKKLVIFYFDIVGLQAHQGWFKLRAEFIIDELFEL